MMKLEQGLDDLVARSEPQLQPTLADAMRRVEDKILMLLARGFTPTAIAKHVKPWLENEDIRASIKSIRNAMPTARKLRAKKTPSKSRPRSLKVVETPPAPAIRPTPAERSYLSKPGFAWEDDPMNLDALRNV